jgi:hypothetical protein
MSAGASPLAVVLFPSTQAAIRGEKVLQAAGIPGKLIPVPRYLSSECGMAYRFSAAERERVLQVLQQAGVASIGVHDLRD